MSFSINNKLSLIDNFQLLSSLLDSLVKDLGKDDFRYLSQECDKNTLDLVNQKGSYRYEHKEQLPSKEKFYSFLTSKRLVKKSMKMFL